MALRLDKGAWETNAGFLRTVGSTERMVTFTLGGLALENCSLSFDVKRFAVPERDQHFGVIFSYDNATKLRIYCRGKTLHYWHTSGDKTLSHTQLGEGLSPPLPSGDAAAWTAVAISSRGAYVHAEANGRSIGTIRREPAVLQSVLFYSYRLDCAFDNLRIVRLPDQPKRDAEPTVPQLAFHAAFDGSLKPDKAQPNAQDALIAGEKLSFSRGVFAQGVRVSRNAKDGAVPLLHYHAGDAFSGDGGTIMFWFRPEWDGEITNPKRFPWYGLFQAFNEKGEQILRIWQWNWLRADLPRGEGLKGVSVYNRCRGAWLKGAWHHVALVWDENEWSKLYVDGIPYERGLTGKRYLPQRTDVHLEPARTFSVGSTPANRGPLKTADGTFDELRIYKTPLNAEQVTAEMRRARPVDLVLERRFLEAGKAGELTVELAPAGKLVAPTVGTDVRPPIQVELDCRLMAEDSEQALATKTFTVSVHDRMSLAVATPPLQAGNYRMTCAATMREATSQWVFRVVAYETPVGAESSTAALGLGAPATVIDVGADLPGLLASAETSVKTLNGVAYREAGTEKADRFAFEIEFPPSQTAGPPVVLDIVWPDDRPRSMGLYMYPESESRQHRDRLEGGIQSGEEYPVSGTMRTTRYLFYPDRHRYLFEARTMVPGLPAAVAAVTVRPVTTRLPRLAIDYPPNATHRTLGHMDEDQSFEVLFRKGTGPDTAVRHLAALCDYLDYTGQETVSYPLLRYHSVSYPAPDNYSGHGLRPAGWIDLFLQIFGTRGKRLITSVNLTALPDFYLFPDRVDAFLEQDVFTRDALGDLVRNRNGYNCNPVHPAVRKAFFRHVGELLRRYGRRQAFAGLDLWLTPTWTFMSLDQGYDDVTVSLFEKETGQDVPDAKGRRRFAARHVFLTGPGLGPWLAWRAAKTTALLATISDMATDVRPDFPVRISVPVKPWQKTDAAPTFATHLYRDFALDTDALKELPAVVLVPQRGPTTYRHVRHWDNSETRYNEVLFDRANAGVFRTPGRAASASYLRYFESFNDSLKPDRYAGHFQNADVKAHGRFFLKEFAFCLATMDTSHMLIGAQPLGTAGRDAVTREFARAYCALPEAAFDDAPGGGDPVTVRYRQAAGGTYLYAVNTIHSSLSVTVHVAGKTRGTNLSDGTPVATKEGKLEIALKPFQLRSFRLKETTPQPRVTGVSVPDATVQWYRERITAVRNSVQAIAATGADVGALRRHLDALQRAAEAGAYAEAHRLLFARDVRVLTKVAQAAAQGLLKTQAEMIARSNYAVNCGQGRVAFYQAKSGTLFFPDQPFVTDGYGYHGGYKSVIRPVAEIVGTSDPELYATEAYDIDGYRFAVEPGSYTVRLHLKVGYEPSARPGVFVFGVSIENRRVLENADLLELCGGDFNRAIVREFAGVRVDDGVLDVDFSYPAGGRRTARLCNAIEVVPEGVRP